MHVGAGAGPLKTMDLRRKPQKPKRKSLSLIVFVGSGLAIGNSQVPETGKLKSMEHPEWDYLGAELTLSIMVGLHKPQKVKGELLSY